MTTDNLTTSAVIRTEKIAGILSRVARRILWQATNRQGDIIECRALATTGRVIIVQYSKHGVEVYVALEEVKFDDIEAKLKEMDNA